jgi:predicted kinase
MAYTAKTVTLEEVSTLTLLVPPAADPSRPAARVVLVGGVPGAGKTTAIARVAAELPAVDALDPESFREGLRRRLPAETEYSLYRPLVHILHALRVLLVLLRGPVPGRTLVVHDPATRPRRRWLFARLARSRGWEPVLLYVDVPRVQAETGQVLRGRVVDPVSFAGHWARWEMLRAELVGERDRIDGALWSEVVLTDRNGAARELARAVAPAPRVRPAVGGAAGPARAR